MSPLVGNSPQGEVMEFVKPGTFKQHKFEGKHVFAVMVVYTVDYESLSKDEGVILDTSNLLTLQGPFCIFCDIDYKKSEGVTCVGVASFNLLLRR